MATRSPESSVDLDSILDNINYLIEDKLPKSLNLQHLESATSEQIGRLLDEYETFLYEIKSLLSTSELASHQLLWLESLRCLAGLLLRLKHLFARFYLHIPFYEIEPIFDFAVQLNSKLSNLTTEFTDSMLSVWLFSEDSSLQLYSNSKINQRLLYLLFDAMELLIVDEMEEDSGFSCDSILNSMQFFLQRYSSWCIQEKRNPADCLPILTQFSKVVYLFGESTLLIPLLDLNVFDPEIPMNIILQNNPINFVDVINFYRFTAFNLVTLSLETNPGKINDKYTKLADIYLKILLNFPNLNLNAYADVRLEHGDMRRFAPQGGVRDKREDFIVSVPERQELSLMYILNSLLSLTSLVKFIELPPLYKSELSFLVKSLSNSLSKDIDELASQPTSTHSSVISFPQLNQLEQEKSLEYMQKKIINKSKFKSITSILIHGSYKEKLGNIVKLCNLLNDSRQTIPALYSKYHATITEAPTSTGSKSLRNAVESILKLLILLSLQQLQEGVDSISVANLKKLFFINENERIENIFKVKQILDYEIVIENGQEVLKLSPSRNVQSVDFIVKDQLELSRLSQKLKEVIS
ncbi:hypothetical protein JA1_000874 [Spathaspora sp. JA1]|nr:hypothetical protein JA1_000874 [Spathaspora sp. JA1]